MLSPSREANRTLTALPDLSALTQLKTLHVRGFPGLVVLQGLAGQPSITELLIDGGSERIDLSPLSSLTTLDLSCGYSVVLEERADAVASSSAQPSALPDGSGFASGAVSRRWGR